MAKKQAWELFVEGSTVAADTAKAAKPKAAWEEFTEPGITGMPPPIPTEADMLAAEQPLPQRKPFIDPQRAATNLELVADVLNTAEYANAGREMARPGENFVDAMKRGVQERRTYGQNMLERDPSMNPKDAALRGLTKAIALDPLTYLSLGATTGAGRAARSAAVGLRSAEYAGDASRIAREAAEVARVGRYGETLGEQAKLGQRALVSVAGKPLVKGTPVYQTIDKLWEVSSPLRKKLGMGGDLPLGSIEPDMMAHQLRMIRAADEMARQNAQRVLQPTMLAIDAAATQHKVKREDLDRILTLAVERAKDPVTGSTGAHAIRRSVEEATDQLPVAARASMRPHIFRMVRDINRLNAESLGKMMDEGIDIGPLVDERIGYMPRIKTDEAARQVRATDEAYGRMGGSGVPGLEVITERTPSQKERAFKGYTTPDINEMAARGELEVLGYKPTPGGLFEENPAAATIKHAGQAARSARSAQLLKGYAAKHGGLLPNLDDVELAGYPRGTREKIIEDARKRYKQQGMVPIKTTIKGLEEFYVPKDMAEPFRRHMAAQADDGEWLEKLKQFNRVWARWTVAFPVSQARNQLGDFYNGYVIGGTGIGDLIKSTNLMWNHAKGKPYDLILNGKRYTAEELMALANAHGLHQSTRTEQFVPPGSTLRLRPKDASEVVGRVVNENVYQRNFWKLAENRDFANRMAMLINGLDKGLSPEAATIRVMEHFFDYSQLGRNASRVRDYAMPFLAWTRYNVPFQLAKTAQRPALLGHTQKAREAAALASGEQPTLGFESGTPLPQFMEDSFPLRVGKSAEGNPQFFRMQGTLPSADLATALDPGVALRQGLGLLSPFITTPIESAWPGGGINLYGSDFTADELRPLEAYPGQTENFLGVDMNKRWQINALENFRLLSEINRANPGGIFGTTTEPGWFGAGTTRSRPDPDPGLRLSSMLIGRPYAFDEDFESQMHAARQRGKFAELRVALRRAVRRGRTADANRIREELARMGAEVNTADASGKE